MNLLEAARRLDRPLRRLGVHRLAVAKRLYWGVYGRLAPRGRVVIAVNDYEMAVDPHDGDLGTSLYRSGVWEELSTGVASREISPGMVVADVGANIGYYTLLAARLVGDEGHVYAFEPEPRNFEALLANVELNGLRNVTAVRKAVWNRSGTARLAVNPEACGWHTLGEAPDGWTGVEVDAIRLDDFFGPDARRIDFVKIDVQGAEHAALEGMEGLLAPDVKILTEFFPTGLRRCGSTPEAFLSYLTDHLGLAVAAVIDDDNRRVERYARESLLRVGEMECRNLFAVGAGFK